MLPRLPTVVAACVAVPAAAAEFVAPYVTTPREDVELMLELAPGTRVLSNSFHMGEWQPDQQAQGRSSGGIMLWIVPADVAGEWSLSVEEAQLRLTAEQTFQEIDLDLRRGDERLHVLVSVLRGDRIAFAAGDGRNRYAFNGRVDGERMQGVVQVHAAHGSELKRWRAVRR